MFSMLIRRLVWILVNCIINTSPLLLPSCTITVKYLLVPFIEITSVTFHPLVVASANWQLGFTLIKPQNKSFKTSITLFISSPLGLLLFYVLLLLFFHYSVDYSRAFSDLMKLYIPKTASS